jgi:hypothetical protein
MRWGLLGLLALGGCIFLNSADVTVARVEIASLGVGSGTARVNLEVTNASRGGLDIRGFLYELEVENPDGAGGWQQLAEGFYPDTMALSSGQARRVSLLVPFQYEAMGAGFRSFLTRGEVAYRLSGEVWMGGSNAGLTVPFRQEGVLGP